MFVERVRQRYLVENGLGCVGDAWRVLRWLVAEDGAGALTDHFAIDPLPFGRAQGSSFEHQVRFEGWILGA